ncbi:MAG: UDP-N-acetylmuramoyl-tripeptide--D-alanyl-D-alanine ligase [Leptospiraceae bacterium]|nr:UDP-N-acetylmuramoyl-tripeptide--D-alanyl-D-alanine ligase [Leptospiraceae bacterium]
MIEVFNYNLFTIRSLFGDKEISENKKLKFICTSSTEVKPNTLFVPLRGNRDGHEFIPDALSRGASAFLSEIDHPILKELSFAEIQKAIFVSDTLSALGKLASFHRNRFAPLIIGITGSSGKTTTKELMGLIVRQIAGNQLVVTEKNYNNEIGVPFTLFRINENTKIVVCEMGMNHKGEISRLSAMVKPDYGLITNVGPCHIENLGSLENIAHAKSEIIDGIPNFGVIFIPEKVSYRKIFQEKAKKKNITVKTFSIKNNPNIKIEEILPEGFKLNLLNQHFFWKIPGEKILENITGVLSLARDIKISPEKILKGLSSYKASDKRFVIEKSNYKIINDTYNANPDSMVSSLIALKQISADTPYYAILGDMKELGKFSKSYHSELGEFCKSIELNGLISFGIDSKWITKSFYSTKKDLNLNHFIDSSESIEKLILYIKSIVPKGSYILIKGSRSMKMERIVEGLKH